MDNRQLSERAQQRGAGPPQAVGDTAPRETTCGEPPKSCKGPRRLDGVFEVKEIFSGEMRVERKRFFFDLCENPRGRFLRIMEEVSGRKDAVMIPSGGLENFRDVLDRSIQANVDAGPPPVVEWPDE